MKSDEFSGLQIDEMWPVSTSVYPNGGIGVYWSGNIGFGEFILAWGEDGKLHVDTEYLDNEQDRRFTQTILSLIAEQVVIDG